MGSIIGHRDKEEASNIIIMLWVKLDYKYFDENLATMRDINVIHLEEFQLSL